MRDHHRYVRLANAITATPFYVPRRPGTLGHGYSLWGRHPDGDVLLHCGAEKEGWYDRFTPVKSGESWAFVIALNDQLYRLVRGVDEIPAGFEPDRRVERRRCGLRDALPNGERRAYVRVNPARRQLTELPAPWPAVPAETETV